MFNKTSDIYIEDIAQGAMQRTQRSYRQFPQRAHGTVADIGNPLYGPKILLILFTYIVSFSN